jgi:hypothetical protein
MLASASRRHVNKRRPYGLGGAGQASRSGALVGSGMEMRPGPNPHTEVVEFVEVPRGRPSPKLAITVDPDVYDGVVAAAAQRGKSVSAWITAAAREALLIEDGLRAVAEWEADHGKLTDEELRAARARVADYLAAPGQSASS